MNGKSTPSLAKAIDIADLFQISTDRLMGAEFSDLLAQELADPERYRQGREAHPARPHEAEVRVSDDSPGDVWEDWRPAEPDPEAEHFKWGWNEVDGESIWPVGGPGDGWPAHAEQLEAAWGRRPDTSAGDVLGMAEYLPARESDAACVVIDAYYGEHVPGGVIGWFKDAFPDTEIRLVGSE